MTSAPSPGLSGKSSIMRIDLRMSGTGLKTVLVALALVSASPASALDLSASGQQACCEEEALEALREGARAYYAGDKRSALDGLTSAAEGGHPAAQWKLGRMYADGDGVAEDDLKAFEYFSQIIAAHGDDAPNSPQAPFVANAFVSVGSYYMNGISNSDIQPNAGRAREIFTYAASYFGDAQAQVNLGRMYLDGIGGDRDPRQAARWFLLAARKGQLDAQIRLGEMLVNGDEIEPNLVHGLMWLTVALKRSTQLGMDEADVRTAHERGFAVAAEDVRRKATALAEQWLADNPVVYVDAAVAPPMVAAPVATGQ